MLQSPLCFYRTKSKTGQMMNPKIGTSYASACDVNLGDYFSRCFDLSDILSN